MPGPPQKLPVGHLHIPGDDRRPIRLLCRRGQEESVKGRVRDGTRGLVLERVPVHLGTETFDIGMLYSAVAGLLNAMVLFNAWAIVIARREGEDEPGLESSDDDGHTADGEAEA